MNRSSLISLISLIFCGLYSFSQNITIDGNGTVRCPSAPLGTSEVISGKTYYVVDRDAILSINNTGSFTVGSSTITPTDLSCVCTSQVSIWNHSFMIIRHLMMTYPIGILVMLQICIDSLLVLALLIDL